MKKLFATLFFVLFASASFAQADDSVVRWRTIVGLATAPKVDNLVAGISAGAGPWNTTGGHARVSLKTGSVDFQVEGLVLNGSNFSGTVPTAFPNIVGTLVCDAGTASPTTFDTPQVPLSQQGDAGFSGQLVNFVPGQQCTNPLFLVRVPALAGKWIATGSVRITDN